MTNKYFESVNPMHTIIFNDTVIETYHLTAGQGITRTASKYDIGVICHSGKISVRKENIGVEMDKNSQPVILSAKEWHQIEVLEPGTVFDNITKREY